MLEVVGTALVGVSSSHKNAIQRNIKGQELEEEKRAEEASRSERIRRGIYHDGRLDCVAGNGIMSELGFGDELMTSDDMEGKHGDAGEGLGEKTAKDWEEIVKKDGLEERERKQDIMGDPQAFGTLPIVVIRNFASKGGAKQGELLTVLASWAATLTDNQVGDCFFHASVV
jgi:RNA12 protein